jgi:putative N6-adenine-specific DNA methylase
MSRFFVSCPLGFEKELEQELKEVWMEFFDLDGLPTRSAVPEFLTLQGGIELDCAEHLGCQINLFSKLANRVLLRVANFECRYFDQFEKNMDRIKFSDWISSHQSKIKIKVETSKSRLNNQKNLIEAFTNCLKRQKFSNFVETEIDESSNLIYTVYVRAHHDRFTISLDTSGDHLHRRGYAAFRVEAPIRETLASFMVRRLFQQMPTGDDVILVDLFCGSGTLLFEAAGQKFPNLDRNYIFDHLRNCPKIFQSESWKKNYRWLQAESKLKHYIGIDRDPNAIKAAHSNQIKFLNHFQVNAVFDFISADSESVDLSRYKKHNSTKFWCLCNPPYGIRISDDSALKVLHAQEYQLNGLALVHPVNWNFKFKKLKLIEQTDFNNQGIQLKFSIFKTF